MTITTESVSTADLEPWLRNAAQKLNHTLTGSQRDEVITELRAELGVQAPFRQLASLALLSDGLRVAHLAIEADARIDAEEILRIRPLVELAAPIYYQVVPQYEAFAHRELSDDEVNEFLRVHRDDRGPFGNGGTVVWRGLRLCQRIADVTQNEAIVRDHERMLVWIMNTVFAGRDSSVERAAHQNLRDLFERQTAPGRDPRVTAFCRPDGPEVFSSVAFGSQVFERDPFDVENIHREAREVFRSQVERAITAPQGQGEHGRMLLIEGRAGSGKTHLLRAFRTMVHELGLGFVGYLQMSSDVGDYSRYVLVKLIDSLDRPYDPPSVTETALLWLSDQLAERGGVLPRAELERLRSQDIAPAELPTFLGELVDRLARTPALSGMDTELLQALLLFQRRDPAVQRRVIKFLRCESLNEHDQRLLGGLAPRLQPEDPGRIVEQLGKLAFALDGKALVLLVDQIEDNVPGVQSHERIQRAIDTVRRITDAIPSSVVVLACLDDVYVRVRAHLVRSIIDRLERDPGPIRLVATRTRREIEQMLARRLEYLYERLDVAWREDEPCFPFETNHIDELVNQQARDCLTSFRKHHETCIRTRDLVPWSPGERTVATEEPMPAVDFDRSWSDALVNSGGAPEDDLGLLKLVEGGLRACAEETGSSIITALKPQPLPRLSVRFEDSNRSPLVLEVCNRQPQGGHLGNQLEGLRKSAKGGHKVVALRTSEFSFGPRSNVARVLGELIQAGGMAVVLEDADLSALAAFPLFMVENATKHGFAGWRNRARPLGSLSLFRKLLEHEPAAQQQMDKATLTSEPQDTRVSAPLRTDADKAAASTPPAAAGHIRLGVTASMRGDLVSLDQQAFIVHAAFLGSTGSGKTTLALNVIEQLLERGVSVLMVDRKGDLARYASPSWWNEVPGEPEQARRKATLRGRLDVELYTPGDFNGRPLRIPVIPPGLAEMTSQDREQVAKTAAEGLGAMLGYGKTARGKFRQAVLQKAIELHAGTGSASLRDLQDTISRPDPELIAQVASLTKHFPGVAEDLDYLAINRGNLLSAEGEALDISNLLTSRPGRARLIVISTAALQEASIFQFWMSRLLVELGRLVRRTPSSTLRAVAFFDEADLYIPAVSSPPTKEPMFELLRRARSGGLGVLLASQNTADFDYKARDNINTWFLGKIAQERAIDKMRNLLNGYPNVSARLASQSTGSFFLINSGLKPPTRELRADRSLMKTEQLAEQEIAQLARAGRPGGQAS